MLARGWMRGRAKVEWGLEHEKILAEGDGRNGGDVFFFFWWRRVVSRYGMIGGWYQWDLESIRYISDMIIYCAPPNLTQLLEFPPQYSALARSPAPHPSSQIQTCSVS